MCVGAMLESQVQRLVYAIGDRRSGAAGSAVQVAQADSLPRRLEVVSGIRADEALELVRDEPWFAMQPAGAGAR
jgi:tRNA(adenine34) deaminase